MCSEAKQLFERIAFITTPLADYALRRRWHQLSYHQRDSTCDLCTTGHEHDQLCCGEGQTIAVFLALSLALFWCQPRRVQIVCICYAELCAASMCCFFFCFFSSLRGKGDSFFFRTTITFAHFVVNCATAGLSFSPSFGLAAEAAQACVATIIRGADQ